MRSSICALSASLVLLVGCGGSDDPQETSVDTDASVSGADSVETPVPSVPDIAPEPISPADIEPDFIVEMTLGNFKVSSDYDIQPLANGESFNLSGYVEDESVGGHLFGVTVELSEAMEAAASGKTVQVLIRGRMAGGVESGPVDVGYSTADVGNSGWQRLTFTDEMSVQMFEYDVPEMNRGRGDFLGILPDPDNAGNVFALHGVAFKIVE